MFSSPTNPLSDHGARERFRTELSTNFSVIAPAGVGKTRAVVERVVQLALADMCNPQASLLERLVVVTYTRKAASEMQARALSALREMDGISVDVLTRFHQSFFGTIHSFCLELLRTHGVTLGVASSFELVEEEGPLWLAFVRQSDALAAHLSSAQKEPFLRHVNLGQFAKLALALRPHTKSWESAGPYPHLDLKPLLDYTPTRKNTQVSVEEGQAFARRWWAENKAGEHFLPLPSYKKGGKDFLRLWVETFQPLREWVAAVGLDLAESVARAYRCFRLSRGLLTYDDMTHLAVELLRDVRVGSQIRSRGYRVILDEAQDTDREQFEVLIELARPTNALGSWLEDATSAPPEPGHFCMVGDPQQSIYGSRADLPTYLRIHERFVSNRVAEALYFQTTFRCDHQIVNAVNAMVPAVFAEDSRKRGQVAFVPLQSRSDAGEGQVIRCPLAVPEGYAPKSSWERSEAEARVFAQWFKTVSLETLRADDWGQVALLCPRNDWLVALAKALEVETEHRCQIHSHGDTLGDDPAYAWMTALAVVLTEPENGFEIVGVLRDIFGVSDHELALWTRNWRVDPQAFPDAASAFQVSEPYRGQKGSVAEALNCLVQVYGAVSQLSLRDAVWHLVEAVELRERLAILPSHPPGALEARLDELLFEAANCEQEGLSLEDWARGLKEGFGKKTAEITPLPGYLQLYSCYKAKGLEWQAVILPYFYRPIGYAVEGYPRLLDPRESAQLTVVVDDQHECGELKALLAEERQQELERLLYVATTRAKRTLVLVDDANFFAKHEPSFARLLKVLPGEANHSFWASLPSVLTAESAEKSSAQAVQAGKEALEPLEAVFDPACVSVAQKQAWDFVKRVLPSGLAGSSTLDSREVNELSGEGAHRGRAGADYGNWWHAMMETTPWSAGRTGWQQHFQHCSAECPDPQRGEREVQHFLQSDLAQKLEAEGLVIRTEVPFLWADAAQNAYDGLIDLVVYNAKDDTWWVVDWKTDKEESADQLLDIYKPQLSVYVRALSSIVNQSVNGYLYSTPAGLAIELKG